MKCKDKQDVGWASANVRHATQSLRVHVLKTGSARKEVLTAALVSDTLQVLGKCRAEKNFFDHPRGKNLDLLIHQKASCENNLTAT